MTDCGTPADRVWERLRRMSELSDLGASRRLHGKLSLRPEDVAARLRTQSALRDACLAWRACGLSMRR